MERLATSESRSLTEGNRPETSLFQTVLDDSTNRDLITDWDSGTGKLSTSLAVFPGLGHTPTARSTRPFSRGADSMVDSTTSNC